jgi:fatty-acid desaturase
VKTLKIPYEPIGIKGVLIGMAIIFLWFVGLFFLLTWEFSLTNPLTYVAILVQMHLYTGLFITAHDAMHGIVSENKRLNHAIGWFSAVLFSFNFYWKLYPKHHEHHRFVATDKDPDYHRFRKIPCLVLEFYSAVCQYLADSADGGDLQYPEAFYSNRKSDPFLDAAGSALHAAVVLFRDLPAPHG